MPAADTPHASVRSLLLNSAPALLRAPTLVHSAARTTRLDTRTAPPTLPIMSRFSCNDHTPSGTSASVVCTAPEMASNLISSWK